MTKISEVTVEPKMPWSAVIEMGRTLTITDLEGQQAVDFLCYDADDLIGFQQQIRSKFKVTFTLRRLCSESDSGKPLLTVVKDTVGGMTPSMVAV